ncbi:hypothetical protein [Pseudoalteromonas holothuriae]|nr:hypothetical protein [Pseudoalteromonas sp. CIP111854]
MMPIGENKPSIHSNRLNLLHTDKSQLLTLAYSPFFDEKESGNANDTRNTQEQSSGSHKKALIKNKQLELKAIVRSSGKPYALISVVDLKTGEQELVKVETNSSIVGLYMTIESQTKVALSNDETSINLMMYQPKKKENV